MTSSRSSPRGSADGPHWAAGLAAQLRDRPALQQAATVPLILAFYCIVGGDQPLPARRADLYAKVIRRMLTGRWRGSGDRDPDPDACLETLRDWAWSAAASDPVSGVGIWADEFPTPRVRQSQDDRDALDHVAPPLGLTDVDTGMTQRRFVHRSLREYLVAEHVALRMSAEEAVAELLNHLWYDPDWEYAAPAALAMHSQRDQVLKELICRATGGDQLHADLAAIDGCWEIRRFLARVAQESGEGDWLPEAAQMIGQARLDLATSRQDNLRQVVASDWPTSNGLIIEALLALLARTTGPWPAIHPWVARELAEVIAELDPAAEDRAQAREALLRLLADGTKRWAPWPAERLTEGGHPARGDRGGPGPGPRSAAHAARARNRPPGSPGPCGGGHPAPATIADRAQAREALLTLLAACPGDGSPGSPGGGGGGQPAAVTAGGPRPGPGSAAHAARRRDRPPGSRGPGGGSRQAGPGCGGTGPRPGKRCSRCSPTRPTPG